MFSGGDDFFVVGAWDIVTEFAAIIQGEFTELTGGNYKISAGLIVVDPKFPVSRFSDLAHEALEKAKIERNHICVFNYSLQWSDFQKARDMRDTLYELVTKENPESRAIIRKVQNSMRGFRKIQDGITRRSSLNLKSLWNLHYYLRDTKKDNRETVNKEIIRKYETWLKAYLDRKNDKESYINPALIAVAARMAEFLTRNINTSENGSE